MAVDGGHGQRFMTKTQHYRKVTKPLLERKRRARMNLYLDELKDLIVDTMEAQGEHVTKLEKADILELTVNYLKTHKSDITAENTQEMSMSMINDLDLDKFRAGYTQAAYEVSKVFATSPGLNLQFGTQIVKKLGYQLNEFHHIPLNMSAKSAADNEHLLDVKTEPTSSSQASSSASEADAENENEYKHKKIRMRLEINQPKTEDVWRPW